VNRGTITGVLECSESNRSRAITKLLQVKPVGPFSKCRMDFCLIREIIIDSHLIDSN